MPFDQDRGEPLTVSVGRRTFLRAGGAFLLLNTGCSAIQQLAQSAPPAQTPVLRSVLSLSPATCQWTPVSANTAGEYEVLPSGHPSGDIRVFFGAPYPSTIQVDVNQQDALLKANGQGPGVGFYRVDNITPPSTGALFDWEVAIAPPSWRRREAELAININNVSINPRHSGTSKVSSPLTLRLTRPPVPDVEAWLASNPTVRDAIVWETPSGTQDYPSWSASRKKDLRDVFSAMWNGTILLLADPPRNMASLADQDFPATVLSETDAWSLFVAHVGQSLAVEIGRWVTWSLTTYSWDALSLLLDSRQMFRWHAGRNGYDIREEGSSAFGTGVVPAPPWTTLEFLYRNYLYNCLSRLAIIRRVLDWCRDNLRHFQGGIEARNMEDQWQYRGCPPVSRILAGTPFPGGGGPGIAHRTAGCWGTTAFLRAILRVVNIPVKLEDHVRHSMPNFISEGKYLSHGDDPYSQLSKATPPFPVEELLIDQATYDAWFGGNVSESLKRKNVSRQPLELAIKHLPNLLLQEHCKDVADGKSHADSRVFALGFKEFYTVADLEAADLWGRADAKIASLGGCAKIPA